MERTKDECVAERIRTTVYLEDEDLASLDELKAHYRRAEHRRLDRSEVIREAIRAYRRSVLDRPR